MRTEHHLKLWRWPGVTEDGVHGIKTKSQNFKDFLYLGMEL